jgi:hypothetical protein
MNDSFSSLLLGVIVAGLLASGCASTSAPDAWQSTAQTMQREAYGGWVGVRFTAPAGSGLTSMVQGELIAADDDSLWVLPLNGRLQPVSRATTSRVKLTTFDANWGYLSTWATLGALSTISHGAGLALSFPVWTIGGSVAAGNQSFAPIFKDPDTALLRRYARYPQGLPPDVSRAALTAKPLP